MFENMTNEEAEEVEKVLIPARQHMTAIFILWREQMKNGFVYDWDAVFGVMNSEVTHEGAESQAKIIDAKPILGDFCDDEYWLFLDTFLDNSFHDENSVR